MKLSLPAEIQKMIDDRVSSGTYRSREDVVAAAVSNLHQQETFGSFAPGELDQLLLEGERDSERGDVLDGATVFAELRQLSAGRMKHTRVEET